MMKCTDFKNQIDEYCRAELSPELMADSNAHLESCSECSKAVGDHNSLLVSLKAMTVPGPSRGFAERALRVAIDQGMEQGAAGQNNHHRRGFMVGFGSVTYFCKCFHDLYGYPPGKVSEKDNKHLPSISRDRCNKTL